MKTIICNFSEFLEQSEAFKSNDEDVVFIVVFEKYGAVVGNNYNTYDITALTEANIDVYHSHYDGGCGIISPGNVCVMAYLREPFDLAKVVFFAVKDFLQNKGIKSFTKDNDLVISENDVLYKVAGSAGSKNEYDKWEIGVMISINVDIEKINQICTKKINKIPKGLSDYNITTNNIVNLLNIKYEKI